MTAVWNVFDVQYGRKKFETRELIFGFKILFQLKSRRAVSILSKRSGEGKN